MARMWIVIYGLDLAEYLHTRDRALSDRIDLKGINVVTYSMLHNDEDIRAGLLLKLIGESEPSEALIDFPLGIWNKITKQVYEESEDRVN